MRESRAQTVSLVIMGVVVGAVALHWLQPVLIPFVLALFVAVGLAPLIDLQMRYLRLPRAVALLATLLMVLVASVFVATLVSASVNELARGTGSYQEQLELVLQRFAAYLPDSVLGRIPRGELSQLLQIPSSSVASMLGQTANAILGILSQGFVVLVFVSFLLIGGGGWSRQQEGTFGEILAQVRRYLVVSVVLSALTGSLVGSTLILLGVPLAMVFGLLAFLLNFIPTIGSIVATLLPLPVVLISPAVSSAGALAAIAVPALIQALIGNVLAPKILGDSLDLHPVVILMALIFWGMLWGIAGMLLATPITAIVKILLNRFESSRPFAELLAGRIDVLMGGAS